MSIEKVLTYFENQGLKERVKIFDQSSATVELAALAVGCEPAHIAKTMSFLVGENAILVVTAGDARVDNKKFKAAFHQKPKMIPWDDVESYIGHAPGGVCPFEINEGVETYLDISLKRFETVYPAAGSANSAVALSVDELKKHSRCVGWVDVCKNWGQG